MPARRLMIIALSLLLAGQSRAAEPAHPSVSFIVSASNPVRDISAGDLRRIFLGEMSRWSNGHRIILLVRPARSVEGRIFLDRLARMSEIDYSQWWLAAVFGGRAANAPRVIDSTERMIRAVAAMPDAIGFIATSTAPLEPGVAVLTVEHELPREADYPIRAR